MAFAVVLVVLGACGNDEAVNSPSTTAALSGEPAAWVPDPSHPASADDEAFTALVHRVGCNDGTTGTVYPPEVEITATEVIVVFTVEPAPPGAHTCPGNDEVAFEVQLGQPLGDRALVDGICRVTNDPAVISGDCDNDE
jgi:hypothetical protein